MYHNKIVLYSKPYCHYCEAAKRMLSEFDEIAVHDVHELGVPADFEPLTPSLIVYDEAGLIIDKLQGLQAQSAYLHFLTKYKHILYAI